MSPDDFKQRTKADALRLIQSFETLPEKGAAPILGRQLLRAWTSGGANYCAACRAKSRADFISKMGRVEEAGDETLHGLEPLVELGMVKHPRAAKLVGEGVEIRAMVVA